MYIGGRAKGFSKRCKSMKCLWLSEEACEEAERASFLELQYSTRSKSRLIKKKKKAYGKLIQNVLSLLCVETNDLPNCSLNARILRYPEPSGVLMMCSFMTYDLLDTASTVAACNTELQTITLHDVDQGIDDEDMKCFVVGLIQGSPSDSRSFQK